MESQALDLLVTVLPHRSLIGLVTMRQQPSWLNIAPILRIYEKHSPFITYCSYVKQDPIVI